MIVIMTRIEMGNVRAVKDGWSTAKQGRRLRRSVRDFRGS